MAVKKRRSTNSSRDKAVEFIGFVKHNLSRDEKEQFEIWIVDKSMEFFWAELERLVDSYYKFAVREDTYGGGVMASLTCSDPKNIDKGLVLTARAPEMYSAVMLLVFKHLVLFEGCWNEYHQSNKTVSDWG